MVQAFDEDRCTNCGSESETLAKVTVGKAVTLWCLPCRERNNALTQDDLDQKMTRGRLCTSIAERAEWYRWTTAGGGIELEPEQSAALICDVNLLLQMLRDLHAANSQQPQVIDLAAAPKRSVES